MAHGPVTEWKQDASQPLKTRLGFWMFVLYALVYTGFILINVGAPKLMGADIGSLNPAIVYGFGLIVFALFLALIYNDMSAMAEQKYDQDGRTGTGER